MPTLDWVNKQQALEATRAVPMHPLKAEAAGVAQGGGTT